MGAHPVSKPWPAAFRSMLSMQADMSMLNGDFEHFDEAGTELLAGKEVGVLGTAALVAILP